MSNNSSSAGGGGIGFAGLLTILFIGLKLTHYIDWSWWWVLSPSLVGVGIVAVLLLAALAFYAFAAVMDSLDRRSRRNRA